MFRPITRLLYCFLPLQLLITIAAGAEPQTSKNRRLVRERPTKGPFVETDKGFMVPYTQRIPGSNATIEMIPIRAGRVTLGPLPALPEYASVESSRSKSAKPGATVDFPAFWMSKYEVTMEQFLPYRELYYKHKRDPEYVRRSTGLKLDGVDAVTGPTEVYEPAYIFEYATKPNSPVPTVTQFGARQYTKWLSLVTGETYRLPFRSEWQHACRAGSTTKYSFGDDASRLNEFAVYYDESDSASASDEIETLLVGTKKPNPWGLFDMHGNVAEWVIEDTATYGLIEGHVACGGSWLVAGSDECQSDSVIRSDRDWWSDDPDFPRSSWWMTSEESRGTGFRILSPLESPTADEARIYWEVDSDSLRTDVQSRVDEGRGSLGPAVIRK
ncbi:MAG: formylglycine-generating enzyme family protein [Planctomycetota bacterium]